MLFPKCNIFKWRISDLVVFISLWSLACGKNYPLTAAPKPCSRLKATVQFEGAICVPGDKEEWKQFSVDNCWKLKERCPEFNEAGCMWYTKPGCGGAPALQFPVCELKYRAKGSKYKKYNWMEIYYTNQYGTTDKPNMVFDIVELHRNVIEVTAFPENTQEDWPKNVPNGQGERGLTWTNIDRSRMDVSTTVPICKPNNPEANTLCTGAAAGLVKGLFPEGIDKKKIPHTSPAGLEGTTSYDVRGACSVGLIGGQKTDVCKVTFKQNFVYKDPLTTKDETSYNIFMEVQVYSGKAEPGSTPYKWLMRYAYLW